MFFNLGYYSFLKYCNQDKFNKILINLIDGQSFSFTSVIISSEARKES
jgi:hypothetical protein